MRDHRPSRTAVQVAQAVFFVAQDERFAPLLPPGLDDWNNRLLTTAGYQKSWHFPLARSRWYRWFIRGWEYATVPGQMLHLGLRKRCIHDETTAALEDGATQVLVVGAGMDTLCLRLAARFPQVRFIEVDHPASQVPKRRAIEAEGGVPANLELLTADLAVTPLEEVLAGSGRWRSDERGVIVAEGLLMYLEEAAVLAFLETARRLSATGGLLLFTYIVRNQQGKPDLGRFPIILGLMLKAVGEPMRWHIRRDAVPQLVAGYDFHPAAAPRTDFRQRYLAPAGFGDVPLGEVEGLMIAERTMATGEG